MKAGDTVAFLCPLEDFYELWPAHCSHADWFEIILIFLPPEDWFETAAFNLKETTTKEAVRVKLPDKPR